MKSKNKVGLKIFIWIVIVALFWSIIGPVVYSLFPTTVTPVVTTITKEPEATNKSSKNIELDNKEELKTELDNKEGLKTETK